LQADILEKDIHFPFLEGGGEMGELTRAFDWTNAPVGSPQFWPQSLRTTVSTVLHSGSPMVLLWGDDLIQFYNDAYRPSLGIKGKHPAALGQKAKDCWPEIWTIIKPMIDRVLGGGGATWSEDQLLPIMRNGQMEDVYWTFSHNPVLNEEGKIRGVLVICNETTEKVLHFKRLYESKQELSFAVDASELGTWDINPYTQEFLGNNRLKQWFGLGDNENIAMEWAIKVVAPQDRQRVLNSIHQSLTFGSGGLYDIEYTIINPHTQEERIVRALGKAIFDDTNIAKRFSGIIQDITEKKAIEDRLKSFSEEMEKLVQERTFQLENKNKELERSNSSLEEFTHIASHDLKEPMRKIHFFSDRLKSLMSDRMTEDENIMFSRIENANNRMMALIDDLLLYSRFSQRPLQMEAVDLNEKIRKVLEDLEVEVHNKKAIVNIHPLPVVVGYPVQLQQLFQNLIGNALKYHQQDLPPVVDISFSVVSGKQLGYPLQPREYYLIEVTDNGIGFDQVHSERIFQMFQRLHGNAEYRGTGVGLAIARKVTDNHHGRIVAQSEPGKGSKFILYLPV